MAAILSRPQCVNHTMAAVVNNQVEANQMDNCCESCKKGNVTCEKTTHLKLICFKAIKHLMS